MMYALQIEILLTNYLADILHLPLKTQALLVRQVDCEFFVDYLHST